MLSVLSWIWTHVAVSVSYDDSHYTTGTFLDIWYDLVWLVYEFLCETRDYELYVYIEIFYGQR